MYTLWESYCFLLSAHTLRPEFDKNIFIDGRMLIIKQIQVFTIFFVMVDEADLRCMLNFLNHNFLASVTRMNIS